MDQHTYSFPKVSPADPHELRERLHATRREALAAEARRHARDADADDRSRPSPEREH